MMPKLGATGQFPFGRLNAHDEGELTLGVAVDRREGVVRVAFGKPVGWLGLPSAHARQLAQMLIDAADALDKSKS